MTVVITRNLPDRFRGFLASCMLEVAPGIYVQPEMTRGVRERVQAVLTDWAIAIPDDGGILILWRDPDEPSGMGINVLGWPKTEILQYDGLWLARHDLTGKNDIVELRKLLDGSEKDHLPQKSKPKTPPNLPAVVRTRKPGHNI